MGNWRTASSLPDSSDGYMSDIWDPEDFMERPCVKSITSCSKRLTRLQHHVKYANAGSMLIMFAKRNTCAHLFAFDWIWYSSTGRTQTLYKLTSVSAWTCDFHICFSSSVTQFLAIPIHKRISNSLLPLWVVQAPEEMNSLTTSTWLGPTWTTCGTGSVPPIRWIL